MARYNRPVLNYDADTVWAAACAAQRINGAYIKSIEMVDEKTQKVPGQRINREIMKDVIANPTLITDEDRKAGADTRTYYKGLAFKLLQDKKLSDFDNTAMLIANRAAITSMLDVAIIAALPSCYERGSARDNADRRINMARGGFLGRVGDKIEVDLEILRSIFSANYGIYFVTGVTVEDNAVFFAFKKPLAAGATMKVKGTVKAHRDTSTQLNRVKVVD